MPNENSKGIGIEDQLRIEQNMIDLGIQNFNAALQDSEQNDRTDEIGYARRLMSNLIGPLSTEIKKFTSRTGPGNDLKTRRILKQLAPEKAAYFILRSIFRHFVKGEYIQNICSEAGKVIEDELKFSKFHEQQGEYYTKIIKDFKRKGTKNYRHMSRVLTKKATEKNIGWKEWTMTQKISVGLALLKIVIDSTDLVHKRNIISRKKKTKVILVPTQTALDWIMDYNLTMSLLKPHIAPCVIEPDDWTSIDQGGFYSPQLRTLYPLIKTRSVQHRKMLEPKHLKTMIESVNIVQRTPWKVNTDILEVLKIVWEKNLNIGIPNSEPIIIPEAPVPPGVKPVDMSIDQQEKFKAWRHEASELYTLETQRVSKCLQILRVLQMAGDYKAYQKFWFTYHCDFRGRIYPSTGSFSPQGPDYARALLLFSNGKKIGARGGYWLKIHGANCYGIDKESYNERIKWIDSHSKNILAAASDPIGNRDSWASAEKPFQFLAFCFEYKRYMEQGDDLVSYLPISVDGSCNGLQNFSAMLRDKVGGSATNLCPGLKPSDIYSEVAKVCTEKLRARSREPEALKILNFCTLFHKGLIPREMAKKPVMTLPYGSTKHSCTDSINDFLNSEHREFFTQEERFKLAVYCTPILWESIGEVVVAARAAMAWLQTCADLLTKNGKPCSWITPGGYLVYQGTTKSKLSRIATQLFGCIRYRMLIASPTAILHPQRQRSGISANLVHSMDACHLMATIRELGASGIVDIICVHDEYGTHACHMDELQYILRQIFVKMYSENNILAQFKEHNQNLSGIDLPEIPSMGDLSLNDILKSEYFFC